MRIWAILYKLDQFSIPLTPHALSFQLTLTTPLSLHQKYFLNQKYLREINLGCMYYFCLLVCVHTCTLEYVLFLCVCAFFLSLCVCMSVFVCADAPVYAGVYCKCTLPQGSSPLFVHFRTKDNLVCLTLFQQHMVSGLDAEQT